MSPLVAARGSDERGAPLCVRSPWRISRAAHGVHWLIGLRERRHRREGIPWTGGGWRAAARSGGGVADEAGGGGNHSLGEVDEHARPPFVV